MDAMSTSAREQIEKRFSRPLSPKQIELMNTFTKHVEAWYAEPDRVPLDAMIEMVPDGAVRAEMRLRNLFNPAWRAFADALVARQHANFVIFDSQHGAFTVADITRYAEHSTRYVKDGREILEISVGRDGYGNAIWPSQSEQYNYALRHKPPDDQGDARTISTFRAEWLAYGLDPDPFDDDDRHEAQTHLT